MLNTYLVDVSSMPSNDVETLYNHLSGFAFIVEEKLNPQTLKTECFRVFLEEHDSIENLLKGFDVKYTDITGSDLMKF